MRTFCTVLAMLCYSVGCAFGDPSAGQIKIAESIATLLSQSSFEAVRGHFNRDLKQTLSVRQMEQTWNALISQTGEFERVTRSQGATVQGADVVEVLCAARQGNLVVRAVFDPGEERLNGLWIAPAPGGPSGKRDATKKPSFPE